MTPDPDALVFGDEPPAALFFVPGVPQPGGSKKGFVVKGRAVITEDNVKSAPWRSVVSLCARTYYLCPPLDGPLELHMAFYFLRPAGHYRTGKYAQLLRDNAPKYPAKKPDLTKLIRSSEDALKGITWRDDSQVVRQVCTKNYGEKSGVRIAIFRIG
jgi:Holliday junction resolvase RusA-like endonuclease